MFQIDVHLWCKQYKPYSKDRFLYIIINCTHNDTSFTARVCWKVMFSYCLCVSWTPDSFAMTNLWYLYGHQAQGHLKVKVILRSKSFQHQIASVWISITKRAMKLRLNVFFLSHALVYDDIY